jgi:integrase
MAWVEQRGTSYRVRYRKPDGVVGTDSSHSTRKAAEIRCKQVDIDLAYDTHLDPDLGRISLAEWVDIWRPGHEAGPARWAAYDSHLRIHILPSLGATPLTRISRQQVKVFVKHLKTKLTERSAADVTSLLSLLLREAVHDRRIGFNPAAGVKVITRRAPERPHAAPDQVNTITERIDRRSDQILVITAAYTGMRWGELAGLARANTRLGTGIIRVHPEVGALHEVGGNLYLGPPKTADSARDIHLPPFLIALLGELLDSHDYDQVFCGARGGFLRRSNMSRRVFRPAVNGTATTPPVIAGMHFHDLRHTHKTWLIEDDIPEVAQAERLGHHIPGVRGIYSHVTPTMRQRLTAALQQRWQTTQSPTTGGLAVVRPLRPAA